MAMNPSEVRAQFPADPQEWNGVDLSTMRPMHKAIQRELVASGMDYRGVAHKYGYSHMSSFYRMCRTKTSIAYREWLSQAGRDSQIADAQEVLRTLSNVLREDAYDEHVTPAGQIVVKKNDTKDVLKAAEILTKVYGMQLERRENVNATIVVDIEGFESEEEGEVIDI